MTYPSGLRRDEAATVAQQFGVALGQVHRDHLISSILAALQAHAGDLIFFGGTALARTYLPAGRLSEDIDLIAVTDRRSVPHAISRTIERALRVTHGRVNWTTRLLTPVRDSFAAWKTAAWFERHAPRHLYDLWALAVAGALTTSAAQLFATHTGLGLPQDHMFSRAPAAQDWQEQLSGQTRLTVSPEEALQVVRSAWSAARS
jgi:hypothetical protein